MKVRDVMTHHVRCVSPTTPIADVAAEMKRLNVGAMPVCEDGKLIGIITDRDITVECVAAGLDPKSCQVREFMTCDPITVGPDEEFGEAFRLMARHQIHRLPVTEQGRVVGILSLGDCAIQCSDDHAVAELLRHISVPVRSGQHVEAAVA